MRELTTLWLDLQRDRRGAAMVKAELRSLRTANAALETRLAHVLAGFPDGVTREEWEVIKELRRCAPSTPEET